MKNAFVISSLIFTVGYPVVVALEMIGVVSFSLPGFLIMIGGYAAISVLAFAFGDYSRGPAARTANRRAPAMDKPASSAAHRHKHALGVQTISA